MWTVLVATAAAADWPMLQGTEAPGAEIRPFGFVQVVGEGIVGGRDARGLSPALSAFDGERPVFDHVGGGDATWGFSLRRARAGLRGPIPGTKERVAFLFALEFGDNGLTRVDPVVVSDASVTGTVGPALHVRAGQFKLPLGEEALEMNPIAAEFVNVSTATGQLLAESPIAAGAYTGGTSGFRDVGAEAFGSAPIGPGELSYALMVSNGRMGTLDVDDPKDVTGRVTFTPLVWGDRGATARDELGAWVFHQQGTRTLDGVVVDRIRQGFGVKLERSGWFARAEVLHGAGMLELGPNPPFAGQPIAVSATGRALGGYALVHREWAHVGGGVRYDELRRSIESDPDLRVFRTVTADLQLAASPKARLMLDYEWRWMAAPHGSPDAVALADTLGDRVSLQVTGVF